MNHLAKFRKYLSDDGFIADLKLLLFPSLFFALMLSLPIHPLRYGSIIAESFNRVFGNAALGGIDPDRRNTNLLLFNMFWIPLCFTVSFVLARLAGKVRVLRESDELREFLNVSSICGIGGIALTVIGKYSFDSIGSVGLYAPFVTGIIVFSTLLFTRMSWNIEYSVFKWGILLSLTIALLLNFLFQTNGEQSITEKYKLFLLFPFALVCIFTILLKSKFPIDRIRQASIPLFFGMFVVGLWLECTNILNQHNIFIINRLGSAKIVIFVIVVICVVLYLLNRKPTDKWETACCIGIILGITYFVSVPPLVVTATNELFEQANHGMLVYGVTHYGKIPLLESFDGHMLKISFRGLLYSWLNVTDPGSIDGSYFYYNCFSVVINVMLFLLLKKLFSKEFALFAILLIPISYIDFYILVLITFIYAIGRKTFAAWLIYFVSLALTAFYELPPATAIGGGTAIMCVALIFAGILREKKLTADAKKLCTAAGTFFGGFGLLFVVLCAIKGIKPLSKVREVLGLILSNKTWAYTSIGDKHSMLFSLLYSLVPIITITALVLAIYTYRQVMRKHSVSDNRIALLTIIVLLLAYFSNYSRAFGRHSLAESGNGVFFGSMFFFVALLFFGAAFMPAFKKQFFVCAAITFPLVTNGDIKPARSNNKFPIEEPPLNNSNA